MFSGHFEGNEDRQQNRAPGMLISMIHLRVSGKNDSTTLSMWMETQRKDCGCWRYLGFEEGVQINMKMAIILGRSESTSRDLNLGEKVKIANLKLRHYIASLICYLGEILSFVISKMEPSQHTIDTSYLRP